MIPAMVAIAAASAISQAYIAEKARGASAAALQKIRKSFEDIVPPEYDISIDDPPEFIKKQLRNAELDFSKVTPETYAVIGKYSPEAAQYVAEAKPELVKGTALQKEGRQAQIEALRQMQAISKGENPELKIRMQQAADQAQQQAQSRSQSLLQDAQRRGQGGSGLSFASMLQGNSDAMQSGAAQSQAAAMAAYRDKLAASQQAGQMGRQLSQDELSMEGNNADVINSFNQRTSRNYQDYLNQRANMSNEAQRFNLGREQDIANRNVGQRNEADMFNLQNRNKLAQQDYQNRFDQRRYQDDIAYKEAAWKASEKEKLNRLKSQMYDDKFRRTQGMAGIASQQANNFRDAAADRNQMIGGLASAGAAYYGQQAQADRDKYAQDREDQRYERSQKSRGGWL